MNKLVLIAIGMIAVLSMGCKGREKPAPPPAPAETEDGAITSVRFTYDRYSGDQVYLNAYVEGLSESGARATVEKRVGPMNYTGHKKEGELTLDGAQAAELLEILARYDLEAWSHLPKSGASSSPSRSLMVFSGEKTLYDIPWNAKFPETLPPQEDILYYELYSFFGRLIAQTPGWEEVRSDGLDDPREDPAYGERRVSWFGHEVRLVPGTGVGYDDGRFALIDYEGKDWWTEEGFTGVWTLDRAQPSDGSDAPPEDVSLTVAADGSVTLAFGGETWSGRLSGGRTYRDDASVGLEADGERRTCIISTLGQESYDRIRFSCYPGPVPEPQFTPIDVYLLRRGG